MLHPFLQTWLELLHHIATNYQSKVKLLSYFSDGVEITNAFPISCLKTVRSS